MNWKKKRNNKNAPRKLTLIAFWNRKKTLDSPVLCVTKLLLDKPFCCDVVQINVNSWNVLLLPCRIARGVKGIDKKKQTNQKNPTKLFWFQFNTLSASQQHLWLLIWTLRRAWTWNIGFNHVFKSVAATDVTGVCSLEPCSNTCAAWQMSVR